MLGVSLAGTAAAQQPATAPAVTNTVPLKDVVPLDTLLAAPAVTISNGQVAAKIYLPDGERGFYRGVRFDWAGVIGSLVYRGHDFYVPWFGGMSPSVRDFVFQDGAVIASPNTAAPGPVEEFNAEGGALGYAEAAAGGVFVKIGVGVLRRPDDAAYASFRSYPLVDSGQRSQIVKRDRVEFTHVVADPGNGYAYRYIKTIRLEKNLPVMLIEHVLRNAGRKPIVTTVYNHNFLNIDGLGTTPGLELSTAYTFTADKAPESALAEIVGNSFIYRATPGIEQRVTARLNGFGATAADHGFHIRQRARGVGLRISGDQPLTQVFLWSIQPVMAIEPFVKMSIAPGKVFKWSARYEFEADAGQAR
jgi:hypothetical protein